MTSESDCVFCRIIAGKIPAKVVQREPGVLAIEDVHPQAPVHLLVMPERHVRDIGAMTSHAPDAEVARLMRIAAELGQRHGGDGFRLVLNTGADGGQTVDHLHVHVIAGRTMHWPPG